MLNSLVLKSLPFVTWERRGRTYRLFFFRASLLYIFKMKILLQKQLAVSMTAFRESNKSLKEPVF